MQLTLIRHGQPQVPTAGSTSDPPLSALGERQAEATAALLARAPVARIWSSGMRRADASAAPLSAQTGLPIETHPGLGEIDRWGGDYVAIESIRERGPAEWKRFLAAPLAYFDIDPVRFRSEALAAFAEVLAGGETGTVAVFTHGFPINILLAHALDIPGDARFVPSHASVTRLAGRSLASLQVVSINESGHIAGVAL